MADERWNKARATLINSPAFDELPVEEKRAALQHLKTKLSESVTVSTKPAPLDQRQVKQSAPTPPKPLMPQRQMIPEQKPKQGPPTPTLGANVPIVNDLLRGMVQSPSRTAPASQGRPTLPPEFEQGLAPSSGGMLSMLQPFAENVLPQFALQASPLGPFIGPLVATAGMQGANYGTQINNGQLTREQAQTNLGTDLAGTAMLGPLNKLLPGNGVLQAATRNVAQGVLPAELDEAVTGRMQDPAMMAVGMGLGAAADVFTGQSPNMASVKQAINDAIAPPRVAQSGSAFADDASFGGVFKKGDEPPTGGNPLAPYTASHPDVTAEYTDTLRTARDEYRGAQNAMVAAADSIDDTYGRLARNWIRLSDDQIEQELKKMPPPPSDGTIRGANDAYTAAAYRYASARRELNAVRDKNAWTEDAAARRNAELQAIDEDIPAFDDPRFAELVTPQPDPVAPPPPPPNDPPAAGAAGAEPPGPSDPRSRLAETLMDNAAAEARGDTMAPLPRGAEGIPSDPNFQLANRNVDEPTQRVMAETATAYEDHIQDRRRGVIPREETKQQAALLGMTDRQLQARQKGQAFNAEQLQAALDLTEASATSAKAKADEFAAKREAGTLTDADRFAFLEQVQNHAMNQAEFSGATAEVARALGVLRAAKGAKRQGEFIKKALDQFGGTEHIDELIDVIAKTDPADLPRVLNKIQDPTWLEKLSTLRKAGLMSGFKTPVKNVVSTGGNVAVQQELSQAIAGTLDWLDSAVTGRDRTTYGTSLPAMIRAGREAITKGGREAGQILKYGATPEQMLKQEATRELKLTRSPKVNAIINMPFRIAGAGDAVMKAYVNRRYIEGMARVAALNEAKSGKIDRKQVKARTRELVENPTPAMTAEAIAEADYQTFNEANMLADKITAFTQTGRNTGPGQLLNFAKDQVLPFLKVPINYYSSQVLDMTGLRPLTRMFMSDRAKSVKNAGGFRDAMKELKAPLSDAERRAIYKAVGMGAVGAAQIILGQSLAKQGLATGTSFSDQGDRGRDDLTRIPRGSVNLKAFGGPDQWVSSSWLFPLITMGAAFQEAGSSTADPLKQAARLAVAGGAIVLEQPFLKGMKDTVDALKNPATAGEHWLGSQAGSFVPSLLNDAASLGDNVKRQAEGIGDSIKARIPGLRNTLPEKTDPFGQPVEQQANFAFDPFQTRADKTSDPVLAEIARLKADVTYPSPKLEPVGPDGEKVEMKLTAEQQNAIRSRVGEVVMPAMAQLMQSGGYQGLNDDEKRDAVEHLILTVKTRVRKAVTGKATQALQPQ
jgi:hypothetical protein